MGPTNPLALINLMHDTDDRIRRTVVEGQDIIKDARWLQAHGGEWLGNVENAARLGLNDAGHDLKRAAEVTSAAERIARESVIVGDEVRTATTRVDELRQRAQQAVTSCRDNADVAERSVREAEAQLHAARIQLAECQQPVYRRGPNGQVMVQYRDCSAHQTAVTAAERGLRQATAYLQECWRKLEQAEAIAGLIATAVPDLERAHGEALLADERARHAIHHAGAAHKFTTDEVTLGKEAVQRSVTATGAGQLAKRHAEAAQREFVSAETGAQNAAGELGKRIDSLQVFNRPRPLPE